MKTNIPFDMLYEMDNFSDYYDTEKLFKHFWRCSLYNHWDNFDFNAAFECCGWVLNQKLSEHGLTSFEDFLQIHDEIYGNTAENIPDCYTWETDYIFISQDEIHEVIMKHLHEKSKETFERMFEDLIDLKEKIDNRSGSLKDDIILFDELIHAEHTSGNIFDIDIESIRDDVEKEYSENMAEIQ